MLVVTHTYLSSILDFKHSVQLKCYNRNLFVTINDKSEICFEVNHFLTERKTLSCIKPSICKLHPPQNRNNAKHEKIKQN